MAEAMPGPSARREILGRVRTALADASPPAPVAAGPPVTSRPDADPLDLFVERVTDYRATVERCAAADVETRVAAALAGRRAAVPVDLGMHVPDAVVDHGLTHSDLDAVPAVVTRARVAIAETGTIVLDHGAGQGRRVLTLLPDVHVCVVEEDQVVPDVPQAVAVLDPTRPQTWISGPSATSDIELSRVEGVHGPRTLHVLLVAH